ncbi:HAD hydrolase-like protein, partial [Treponema sp. OttesenSCG-928-L16]|nr:HAD hydrolase-like protein [Treponema sp. OttesenSCG-928-L16]
MKYKNILFDLDGTLTDSARGIIKGAKYALEKYGIHEDDEAKLSLIIGPPLTDSFRELFGIPEQDIQRMVAYFQEYYSEKGAFENALFPGVEAMLEKLAQEKLSLFVASSKLEKHVRVIISHFGLDRFFTGIAGALPNEVRAEKDELIAYAMETFSLIPEETLMVGDRRFDIEGSHRNQIDSAAVLWGYGSKAELEAAGPSYFCATLGELESLVLHGSMKN